MRGDLVVNLVANTKRFESGMRRAQGRLKLFAGAVTRFVVPLVGMQQAFTAVSLAQERLRATRGLSAVLRATGGVAGESARSLTEYADVLQRTTDFHSTAIVSAMRVLATFKNVQGVFRDVVAIGLDMSSVMGTDLGGVMVQLGKALNDPIRGVGALAEVGVTFNDAQRETIERLMKSNKLFAAQTLILKELRSEFGGAAKAMSTDAGRIKSGYSSMMEQLGAYALELDDFLKVTGMLSHAFRSGRGLGPPGMKDSALARNMARDAMKKAGAPKGAEIPPEYITHAQRRLRYFRGGASQGFELGAAPKPPAVWKMPGDPGRAPKTDFGQVSRGREIWRRRGVAGHRPDWDQGKPPAGWGYDPQPFGPWRHGKAPWAKTPPTPPPAPPPPPGRRSLVSGGFERGTGAAMQVLSQAFQSGSKAIKIAQQQLDVAKAHLAHDEEQEAVLVAGGVP